MWLVQKERDEYFTAVMLAVYLQEGLREKQA